MTNAKRAAAITFLPLAFCMGMAGCRPMPANVHSGEVHDPNSPSDASLDSDLRKIEWEDAYTTKTNLFTAQTYACISEMHSLAYDPVDSGPVCKRACEQWRVVNKVVDEAPATIIRESYYLSTPDFCHERKRRAKKP